ncbi:MAG: GH92 family glycosyl hydrolase [Byssovorax sp.]
MRTFSWIALATFAFAACSSPSGTPSTSSGTTGGGGDMPAPNPRPVVPVAPLFIGSGGFAYGVGSAFPGALAPQGLAKVGPDTKGPWGTASFLHFSGYWYGDDTIQGFSHLHLHGTGATDYGVLAFMPSDGFDASRTTPNGYESHFQKKTESAVPGHYAVVLDRGNIAVDLTATTHAAYHRYTYPMGAKVAEVIVDLDHHLNGGSVSDAEVTLYPEEQRIRGRLHSVGGMSGGFGGYDVFFEARTRDAWTESQVWHKGAAPAPSTAAMGEGVGFALGFDPAKGPVEIKVGLSLVSGDAAAMNLAAEISGWSFEETAKQTAAAWDALLGTVKVQGGSADEQSMMTSAVYHAFLMPTVQSDVDGGYRGMDQQIHKADGYRYVSDLSLWDTYRTLHPLYALIARDRALDAVKSLHAKAKDGGYFPRWPIATGEAGTMLGASAEVVVADAYLKGIKDFDAEGAYQILRAAAMDEKAPPGGRGGRDQVDSYMKYSYVAAEDSGRSVSHTTEYANDDFALAGLAGALGHGGDESALLARAVGYRKLFDPETGFLWAKHGDGTWASSHLDATLFADDFAEANAWQSTWMVAADAEGLATLFGGRDKAVAKLIEMFEQTRVDWEQTDWTNPLTQGTQRPYYWASNEPDINAPYLFAQLGRPDLTQKWVAWLRANVYSAGADGLPGNDDGGTMAAWYVFSALGFYPIAGTPRYVVGAPLFPYAEVAVEGGVFTVDAPAVSAENVYVQKVTLNGAPLDKAEIVHADLKAGGSLVFEMGPKPSSWGQ